MTRDQVIKGMLARQRQLLKLRSKPKPPRASDKIIDKVVKPKARQSCDRTALSYAPLAAVAVFSRRHPGEGRCEASIRGS